MKRFLLPALLLAAITANAFDLPTMGWSSWNTYRVNISDSLIMKQADALVSTGLADCGYRFINIDDGYFGGRDADGRLLFHPVRFPRGLAPVVEHIHSLDLKAGIYSDAGRNTCGNFWDNDTIARGVGLYGHDREDAEMFFNELGFDFIKVDFCGGDPKQNTEALHLDERTRYSEIAQAIKATGRDDVRLNVCRWDYPGTWVKDVAFSWRISHDISPRWESVRDIIEQNTCLSAYCRNGHFNDMDMLEVNRGMTRDEDRTHFGMWCMMSSPLLIGCDLTSMPDETVELLKNPVLLSIARDTLALQAYPVDLTGGCTVYVKDLRERNGRTRALAVYNPADTVATASVDLKMAELGGKVTLTDAFGGVYSASSDSPVTMVLPPHSTRFFIAEAENRLIRQRYEAETAFIASYQELDNPVAAKSGYYVKDSTCSAGYKAAGLGFSEECSLMWDDVTVPADGIYKIAVKGFTDVPASAEVWVNGSCAGRLDFSADSEEAIDVRLREGRNTLSLKNPSGKMPDVDYWDIVSLDTSTSPTTAVITSSELSDTTAISNGYFLSAVLPL